MAERDALKAVDQELQDPDFRRDFGAEKAKLVLAMALVESRKQAGLTQQQLADLAGVTQSWIAELEQGHANPTIGRVGGLLALVWKRLEFRIAPLTIRDAQRDVLATNGKSKELAIQVKDGGLIKNKAQPKDLEFLKSTAQVRGKLVRIRSDRKVIRGKRSQASSSV
jgi:transcriptional regulator with XRE-family HTH domain